MSDPHDAPPSAAAALSASSVPVPAAHVETAEFDGETVLYDTIACRPVLLNVSAAAVWAALDGRRSVDDITAAVAEQFGATAAALTRDVVDTIVHFIALGLAATPPR